MTVTLPSVSAGSALSAYSAAAVNAAINQQKTNAENIANGIQGIDALLWNNSTATLSSDTLSLTGKPRVLVIDTEAAGATDNLSTISNGTAYQQLWLKAANAGRVITVKHNVGNIKLNGAADIVLSSQAWLLLFYDGTQWSDTFVPSPASASPGVAINTARTVLGGNVASVTIGSIPATYQHLLLILEIRTDNAATSDNIFLRFNADATAANYYQESLISTATTNTASEALGANAGFSIQAAVGNTGSAGNGRAIIWITNYASTTMRRVIQYQGFSHAANTSGNIRHVIGAGDWTNAAAAIASITFLPVTGSNILAGSAYTLYGYN